MYSTTSAAWDELHEREMVTTWTSTAVSAMFLTGALVQNAKIKITRHEKKSELHRWAFLKAGADHSGNINED